MRARGLGLLACMACAGAVLAGAVPGASAKPGYYVAAPNAYHSFVVGGSNGYKIEVTGNGGWVEIWVGRWEGGLTKYRVPAQARRGRIKASLGRLGLIDLRFDRDSVERPRNLPGCRGKPARVELGTFRGTVRFHGEEGYTRFSARRVPGSVARDFRQVCKKPGWLPPDRDEDREPAEEEEGPAAGSELTYLAAAQSTRDRSVFFTFVSILGPDRLGERRLSIIGARTEIHERRGKMAIERSVLVLPGKRALRLTSAGESRIATLNLPSPYAGRGTYALGGGDGPAWSGSLRVTLPGARAVPLTGPGFVARLCEGGTLDEISRCLRPVKAEAARGPR